MQTVEDMRCGWFNASIGDLAGEQQDGLFSGFDVVLITSIDSTTDVAKTRVALAIVERYPKCHFLGRGLVLPGPRLAEIARSLGLFSGFDEVWCYEREPSIPKPDDVHIVGPVNLATERISPSVVSWMQTSGARLGLGDGIGLNYVTPDEAIRRRLERLVTS